MVFSPSYQSVGRAFPDSKINEGDTLLSTARFTPSHSSNSAVLHVVSDRALRLKFHHRVKISVVKCLAFKRRSYPIAARETLSGAVKTRRLEDNDPRVDS